MHAHTVPLIYLFLHLSCDIPLRLFHFILFWGALVFTGQGEAGFLGAFCMFAPAMESVRVCLCFIDVFLACVHKDFWWGMWGFVMDSSVAAIQARKQTSK